MASLTDKITSFFGGNDSMADQGLRDLFISELKSVYYVEKRAIDALGDQAEAATTDEVKQAFAAHQQETRKQLERVEEIFRIIGIKAEERRSDAMDGLVNDAKRTITDTEPDTLTRDAGLIIAAQAVEHHEIALYGSLLTLSQVLDFTQSAELLAQTLEEEKSTDHKLTDLAESFVNRRSKQEEDQHPGSHHASRDEAVSHVGNVTAGGTLGV